MNRRDKNGIQPSRIVAALGFACLMAAAPTLFSCAGGEAGVDAISDEATDGKEDRAARRLGQTLEIEVALNASGEYAEPDEADLRAGWKEDEENGGYVLTKTFAVRAAPWRLDTFGYSLSLDGNGSLSLGYSGGDADYGFDAAIKIPKKDGKFIALDVPYELSAGGGDYASGAWGGSAAVKITVKP